MHYFALNLDSILHNTFIVILLKTGMSVQLCTPLPSQVCTNLYNFDEERVQICIPASVPYTWNCTNWYSCL